MKTFNIKPAVAEEKVLDPLTFTPLATEGEIKPRNEYWLRRVLDKSVVEIKATEQEQS